MTFAQICFKCGRGISWNEICSCHYANLLTTAQGVSIMEKVKLSETEKEELKRIRNAFHEKLKSDEIVCSDAYDLGWLFGLIDRMTE